MIKIALKHFIFEFCIHKIFEGIYKNFPMLNEEITRFSVGDCLQLKIYFGENAHFTFRTCKVIYKKGTNMIILTHDLEIPTNLVVKNGILKEITVTEKEKFEDYFDE